MRLRRPRVTVVLIAILVTLFGWQGTASAHASLASSNPADGAVLETAPTELVLNFTEPVDPVDDSVRLLSGDGTPIDIDDADQTLGDTTLRVALPDLDDGTYAVGWSAVSADSHPISGAFLFTVGTPSNNPAAVLLAQAQNSTTDNATNRWLLIGRWLSYAGFALLIGILAVTAACSPTALASRRTGITAAIGAIGATIGTVAMIAAQARATSDAGWSPNGWSDVLNTRSGQWWFARLIPLAIAPVVIRTRAVFARRGIATICGLIAAVASWSIIAAGGHATTGRWATAGFVATVMHLAAMTIWVGALTMIALSPRSHLMRTAVSASPWALASVVVLALTGIVNGARQLDGLSGFTDTSYGKWLLVKLTVVAVIIAVAAVSRNLLSHRPESTTTDGESEPAPIDIPLRRTVTVEMIGIAVVLVTTAGLVNTPPPIAFANPTPITVSASDIQGARIAQIELAPARTGGTTMHVVITSPGGTLDKADEIAITASLPSQQLGPIDIDTTPAGPNHVTTNAATFPVPGLWEIQVTARYGEFDQVVFTIEADIR
jgi:copper transport protein